MKILIITEEYGRSANGLVVENIVKGLIEFADITILTDEYFPKDKLDCKTVIRSKYTSIRIQTYSIKYLGIDILSQWWLSFLPKELQCGFDLIFSVISTGHYAPLRVGSKIKKQYGGHFYAYFVDAIPAPKPFLKDDVYINNISRYINWYCDNVEVIFSATQEMSDYQSTIVDNHNIRFEELYNPSKTNDIVYFSEKSKSRVFTYTGNIYIPRNPKYLLDAFSMLLKAYPDAQLKIIGNNILNYFDSFLKEQSFEVQEHVQCLPFQKDLTEIFKDSSALIDIGCDVENDVYMSNKINGYIAYGRPIICETSESSPASRIFKGMKSVLLCRHNAEELYEAMMQVLADGYSVDYSERDGIMKEMSIKGVAQRIIDLYYGKK